MGVKVHLIFYKFKGILTEFLKRRGKLKRFVHNHKCLNIKMYKFYFILFLMWTFLGHTQTIEGPLQPKEGFGGSDYAHQSVNFQDYAKKPHGYWLFEPAAPVPDSAHVVVFNHGYGAYNPMIYGKWIKHLVQKGNIVIFPRYQRDLFLPRPPKFAKNVSKAIKNALKELEKEGHVKPITKHLMMIGHSYGGVVSANLAINFEKYKIPKPEALLLVNPGTSYLKGGRLKTYKEMPVDAKLLITIGEYDYITGDEFANLVYETAIHTSERNLLIQRQDARGKPMITAGHNEVYCVDLDFDTGIRNYTAKKALRISVLNAVDYNGYWKLGDALMDYVQTGENRGAAFGNTMEQRSLGVWSDGTEILGFEVMVPEEHTAAQK